MYRMKNRRFVCTHPFIKPLYLNIIRCTLFTACLHWKNLKKGGKKTINWSSVFSLTQDTYPRLSSVNWHNAKAAQAFTPNNQSGFTAQMLPSSEIRPATRGFKALRRGFVEEDKRKEKSGASVCLSLSLLAYYNSALTKKRAMERQTDDKVFYFPRSTLWEWPSLELSTPPSPTNFK